MGLSLIFLSVVLQCVAARIPPSQRKFNSTAVEQLLSKYDAYSWKDSNLQQIFQNCYPNPLDTTIEYFTTSPSPDTFVITGDINATWLRDTTNQLIPFASLFSKDEHLAQLVCGVIQRQARDILHDPYANAFNFANEGGPHQIDARKPTMTPHVFEGKWELDSLAAALKLAATYWNSTKSTNCFTSYNDGAWLKSVQLIITTMKSQQKSTIEEGTDNPYFFQRLTTVASDTLRNEGRGRPGQGGGFARMVRSAFRPSDDATLFPYLIPANAMASVELQRVSQLLYAINETSTADEAVALAKEIANGVLQNIAANGVYPYETDGYGGQVFGDDANVPSLLSLPYLGWTPQFLAETLGVSLPASFLNGVDPYIKTRAALLSPTTNPWFFKGSAGKGIGSLHTGLFSIWPMSIIIQALTSDDDAEISECLSLLVNSSAGTGFMHESFQQDDAGSYTRSWFAWANSLFGELIIKVAEKRPQLIFNM